MFCSSCGNKNEPGGKFCARCGAPAGNTTAAQPKAFDQVIHKCPVDGSAEFIVRDGKKRCKYCDTPLETQLDVEIEASERKTDALVNNISKGASALSSTAAKKLDGYLHPLKEGDTRSRFVALMLSIFLGWCGVHRFYLGYSKSGVVFVVLALTAFLIIPGVVLGIWWFIDIIRILTKSLVPNGGGYIDVN